MGPSHKGFPEASHQPREKLNALLEGAIGGMVTALKGPFTSYSPMARV